MKIATLLSAPAKAALVPAVAGAVVSVVAFGNIYFEYRQYKIDFSIEQLIKDTFDLPVHFRGGLTHSQDLISGCIDGPHYGEGGATTRKRCEKDAAEEQAARAPCIADIRRTVHDVSHVSKPELDKLLASTNCTFGFSIGPKRSVSDATFWWARIDRGWAIATPMAIIVFLTAFNLSRLGMKRFGIGLSRAGLLFSALTTFATAGVVLWCAKFNLHVVANPLVNTSLAALGLAECFAFSAVSGVEWIRSGFAADRQGDRLG